LRAPDYALLPNCHIYWIALRVGEENYTKSRLKREENCVVIFNLGRTRSLQRHIRCRAHSSKSNYKLENSASRLHRRLFPLCRFAVVLRNNHIWTRDVGDIAEILEVLVAARCLTVVYLLGKENRVRRNTDARLRLNEVIRGCTAPFYARCKVAQTST
jgi:hypothetical protein